MSTAPPTGAPPRLLVVMGSGETSPTMVATHREVFDRFGPGPVPSVLIDTPFGFQENADELTERVLGYFRRSLGRDLGVVRLRRSEVSPVERQRAVDRLARARLVFSGPGSPSYALRQWRSLPGVTRLLADKLRHGGAVVFASAAALTLGRFTVPVYEVYKVGEEPRWLEGLDLLAELGLSVAVVPHFNNAEGGTHDTRYCYLGERRLAQLEERLPAGSFVLGVDEHTACIFDLDHRTVKVAGLGALTARSAGEGVEFPSGSTATFAELTEAGGGSDRRPSGPAPPTGGGGSPLAEVVARLGRAFDEALAAGDPIAASEALLELADAVLSRSSGAGTGPGDDLESARARVASLVLRLGEWASGGVRDVGPVVGPYVETLIELRSALRSERRFEAADRIRGRLNELGVELQDSPGTTAWTLRPIVH